MSVLPPKQDKDLPQAYGGCTCYCHRIKGVHHVLPCCHPEDGSQDILDEIEQLLGDNWLLNPDETNESNDSKV